MSERNVLINNKHPFLVGLHYAFQNPGKLYLVMDFINGGELFYHVQKEGRFSEQRAKFYAAEIACALGYLHSQKIIYRLARFLYCATLYSRVLKYRNVNAQNDKIQNQIYRRKLSKMQKIVSLKRFLDFYLAYKNVCLKFPRCILRKLHIEKHKNCKDIRRLHIISRNY